MNKRDLSESDIKEKYITPAIIKAGWDEMSQIQREEYFTDGRIYVKGKLTARGKGKFTDYSLYHKTKGLNIRLAVIEAKDNKHSIKSGIQQALSYANKLDVLFVFSSNGDGFWFHDKTATDGQLEKQREILEAISKINAIVSQIQDPNRLAQISVLKQSILQEAIRGKLTAEWRAERQAAGIETEPVSELLKRIQAVKARLIKEKKIKKEKPLPPITEEEKPFELPEGWEWCRLGKIFQSTSGGTPSRSNAKYWNGEIDWYKSGELNDGLLVKTSQEKITDQGLKESSATLFQKGTLLIAMYGATAGKLSILGKNASTNQAICGFYENPQIETLYLFHFLFANRKKMVSESWGMSQPNISQTYLREFLFALPPYEEQKAIVEKVESLMAKCQELEKEISQSEQHAQMLMQAVLKEGFEG